MLFLFISQIAMETELTPVDEDKVEKDHEDQDKLGPLRPLAPSKSTPSMPMVKEPERVSPRSRSDSGSSVPKSASASTLTLLMPRPVVVEHGGRELF